MSGNEAAARFPVEMGALLLEFMAGGEGPLEEGFRQGITKDIKLSWARKENVGVIAVLMPSNMPKRDGDRNKDK